jgi:hypothetical protein
MGHMVSAYAALVFRPKYKLSVPLLTISTLLNNARKAHEKNPVEYPGGSLVSSSTSVPPKFHALAKPYDRRAVAVRGDQSSQDEKTLSSRSTPP